MNPLSAMTLLVSSLMVMIVLVQAAPLDLSGGVFKDNSAQSYFASRYFINPVNWALAP